MTSRSLGYYYKKEINDDANENNADNSRIYSSKKFRSCAPFT